MPQVAIREGGALLACRYESYKVTTTLSLGIQIWLTDEPNVVAIRFREAQAGLIQVPLDHVAHYAIQHAQHYKLPLRWVEIGGSPAALMNIPTEDDGSADRIWIESLELREGELYVAGRVENGGRNSLHHAGEKIARQLSRHLASACSPYLPHASRALPAAVHTGREPNGSGQPSGHGFALDEPGRRPELAAASARTGSAG